MNNSSTSLQKHIAKNSSSRFPDITGFDLYYQLTHMAAITSAGVSRNKLFELAATSQSGMHIYFVAINRLVKELRFDYPEACRLIAEKAQDEDVRTFLLRLSDALRSGEPMAAFMAREAEVGGTNYANEYERDLESLKKWSDAFSSILVSVALIVIVNLVSTMIYELSTGVMAGLVATGLIMGFFGAWVLSRAAPQEDIILKSSDGSTRQQKTVKMLTMTLPLLMVAMAMLMLFDVPRQWSLMILGFIALPHGIYSFRTDNQIVLKEKEVSAFLRSIGGMAAATSTTLKVALTKIEMSSFPSLKTDIDRLSTRLQALVSPVICWQRFGTETGSQLVKDTVAIFYEAIRLGGDPEKVGFLCSLFASRTSLLRAKRRVVVSTFTWLTLVMHVTVAGLMVFVLEIIQNFLALMSSLISPEQAGLATQSLALPIGQLSEAQVQFLDILTLSMVLILAGVSTAAIIVSDGGYKLKMTLYLSALTITSGVAYWVIPKLVARILVV